MSGSHQAKYKEVVSKTLSFYKDDLNRIAQDLRARPELGLEEHYAHERLTTFLDHHGFIVQKSYGSLATAFRAEFSSSKFSPAIHSTVAVLCEYDALPGIGHACGHNLIAEAGVATALAVRDVLLQHEGVQGRVVVIGTPAEESAGGKITLIKEGAFEDVDFAMMVHPFANNDLQPVILGVGDCHVTFTSINEDSNALDAAIAVYTEVYDLKF